MRAWDVRAQRVGERLPQEEELAWRLAEVAADPVPVEPAVAEMAGSRVLDDLAVAVGALGRPPVTHALAAGLAALRPGGATLVGLGPRVRVRAEWAAWANGTADRRGARAGGGHRLRGAGGPD
jgi:2-methylcitrate dehydratase